MVHRLIFFTRQAEPIYMLVPLDMPGANTRISNLKRATADYVAEYNVCKCKPCHNGATLALLGGRCVCLCPHLYEGLACQNYKIDNAQDPGKRERMHRGGGGEPAEAPAVPCAAL